MKQIQINLQSMGHLFPAASQIGITKPINDLADIARSIKLITDEIQN